MTSSQIHIASSIFLDMNESKNVRIPPETAHRRDEKTRDRKSRGCFRVVKQYETNVRYRTVEC